MNQIPNYKQYLSKNSKISQKVFLLLGEEESLKQDFINEISVRHFGKIPEYRHFHHDNPDDFSAFITYAGTSSMFSNAKTAVFSGLEKSIQSSLNNSNLNDLIENLCDDTMLFFRTSSNSVPAVLKKIPAETVIFWRAFENELSEQIRKSFSEKKIQISPADISLILEHTGRDSGKIAAALEKLESYSESQPVNSEMIKFILTNEKE
ncbi:MAG: hypothetical protein JW982_13670, partial [Spirochaetes bacterium]|nr:hypothetical protein [Spirochaetota bacterium]